MNVKETDLSNLNYFRYSKQMFSNFTFNLRLKLFYKLLKDKMNMYLYLSETKLKTILGTILKNSIEKFSLCTIFSLYTTHIYICYQFI